MSQREASILKQNPFALLEEASDFEDESDHQDSAEDFLEIKVEKDGTNNITKVESILVEVHPETQNSNSELQSAQSESDMETDECDSSFYDEDISNFGNLERNRVAKIQQEWDDSIAQLKQAVNWVILPLIGKLLGRKCARFIWNYASERFYS